jgi:hypothetical protein
MSLLDDVSIVVTPNGYKAGTLHSVIPAPTEGSELVTNGDFDTNSNWGLGTGWTISGGEAISTGSNSYGGVKQTSTPSLQVGTTYRYSFEITSYTSGQVRFVIGQTDNGFNYTSTGVFTGTITYTGIHPSGASFLVSPWGDFVGSIDNVSIKEYTSADMDVTRATAGTRVDENGLVNYAQVVGSDLVTNGDFATDIDWIKQNGSTISGGVGNVIANGDLGNTGANWSLYQDVGMIVGKSYKISFSARQTGGTGNLQVGQAYLKGFDQSITSSFANYSFFITPNNYGGNTGRISIGGFVVGDIFEVDNVSVKEIDRDNVPRIDYSDGGCPHILVEPQRTNLVINSNSSLNPNNTSISYSDITSPNGEQNGFKIQSTATGTASYVKTDNINFTNATFSVFVKYGNNQWLQFLSTNTNAHFFNFDVQNGVFGTSGVSTSNLKATQFDNGWYRVSGSFTGGSGVGSFRVYLSDASNTSYGTSTATSGDFLYSFGWQVEEGFYPTSYIPTSGSTITRNQDLFSRDGIGSLINSTEGVLFVEMAALSNDGTNRIITLSDGSYNNSIRIAYYTNTNEIEIRLVVGGVIQVLSRVNISNVLIFNKIAFKYKVNDFELWVNGTEIYSLSSGSTYVAETLNRLAFDDGSSSNNFYGKVKQLQVYKTALTDAQLTALTS